MAGESKLQRKVIEYLEDIGAYVVKIVVANKAGTHDIIFCLAGKFYSVELKFDKNKPSPLQLNKQQQIIDAGGESFVIWTMDELKTAMAGYGHEKRVAKELIDNVPLI